MTADLAAHARELIDRNLYLTLGTADRDGEPWATPVYFAPAGDRAFLWASETGARHSVNIAQRPRVSIAVFDSTVEPYHGRAVYATAEVREVTGDDLGPALDLYPRRDGRDLTRLDPADVTGDAAYRLYRATATAMWVLCPREPGVPCSLHGLAKDHRAEVFRE